MERFAEVFTNKKPVSALRDQLKYDALYPDPSRITVLSNNHDTRRFMSLEGSSFEGAKLHVAFIMTVRGIPQIYAGEEIAMEGEDDPDNRRDFPGGFQEIGEAHFFRLVVRRRSSKCGNGLAIGSSCVASIRPSDEGN